METEESKLLPTISDNSEEQKIFDFLSARFPKLSEETFKKIRAFYPADTLEGVKEIIARRQLEHEEEQQRQFKEKKMRLADLIKSAKIPKIFSDVRAKDFKMSDKNEHSAKIAIKAITENNGLFIYGDCGTGKTMLSSVIANERAELFKPSLFIGAVDIFQELNPYSSDSKTAANRKMLVKNSPCLIIDDLGAEKPSDWTKQTLFEIIDFRYRENLQTIITSNFSIDELKTRLSEYEGSRIIRRIKSICKLIRLEHY